MVKVNHEVESNLFRAGGRFFRYGPSAKWRRLIVPIVIVALVTPPLLAVVCGNSDLFLMYIFSLFAIIGTFPLFDLPEYATPLEAKVAAERWVEELNAVDES